MIGELLSRVRLRGRRPRRLVLVLAVVVLAAGGTGAWLLLRGEDAASAASTTATVSTETLKQTVTASGTLAAASTADLAFAASGTVTDVYVAPGDVVKKGQRLARVDDEVLQAELDAAQSALAAAESTQAENLTDGASDEQVASDEAAVIAATASLAEAEQAADDAVLRSTISGTVTSVGVEVGDAVGSSGGGADAGSGSADSGDDSTTITVTSTGRYVVAATVASADVEKVTKGLQAEITVSGVDETVYGTVEEVGLIAETDSSGAAAFPVTVEVTGTRDDLFAGTSADVSIIVSQRADVLTVTSRALQTDGDTTYVDKVTDTASGATERVDVETGETSGMSTEITSGLVEGDVVLVPGFSGPGGNGGGDQDMQDMMRERMEQGGGMPPGGGFPGGGQ